MCLLWRNVCSSLFFIFKIGFSFYYRVVLFIYSVYRHLPRCMICECLLMCVLFFHLLDGDFFKLKYIWFRRRQWQPTPVLLPGKSRGRRSLIGCSPWGRWGSVQLSDFTFTFHFHALEKEMATHSSVLAWRISGTGEPGGLPSMRSHRVGHDWSDLAAAAAGTGEREE